MDDRQLSAGLADLAEDVGPLHVDIEDVMTRAAGIGRRRRAVAATGLGTVTVLAALGVVGATVGFGPHGDGRVISAAGPTTSPSPSPTSPATSWARGQGPGTGPFYNAETQKLNGQFSPFRASNIPSSTVISRESGLLYNAQPPLEFAEYQADGRNEYTASAQLKDGQGASDLWITVSKYSQDQWTQCQQLGSAIDNCTTTSLPDGTNVTTYDEVQGPSHYVISHDLEAVRRDGTMIVAHSQVDMSGSDTRPTPQLDMTALLKLATTFNL